MASLLAVFRRRPYAGASRLATFAVRQVHGDSGSGGPDDGDASGPDDPPAPPRKSRLQVEPGMKRPPPLVPGRRSLPKEELVPVSEQRTLYTCVLGPPNAGKSTLVNQLVGDKVAAVSAKTNTTHESRAGALTVKDVQLVISDSPGVVGPLALYDQSHRDRVESAWASGASSDTVLFVVDAQRQYLKGDPRVLRLLERVFPALETMASDRGHRTGKKAQLVLVLNKVDSMEARRQDEICGIVTKQLIAAVPQLEGVPTFAVSGHKGYGVPELIDYLQASAPTLPWEAADGATGALHHPHITAVEVTREKIFKRLNQELPYSTEVKHVSWEMFRNGNIRIQQEVLVDDERHRRIVIGHKGCVVGAVGVGARKELSEMFGRHVHLVLDVKVNTRRNDDEEKEKPKTFPEILDSEDDMQDLVDERPKPDVVEDCTPPDDTDNKW
eukprot:CAMPEP_0170143050 /NCGR_PEP_ID=MMETSP0033_2-20121228/9396_1 /TAXON_ID=195969 /ORGANISM="Dolichomastix tenuilepis, Strain CCMP3274" /LENGTH=440 /DNA_ID=CAMNT_0010379469 /DNA_START=57 /DNA_END=1376 /DNA_ORIENTATION=+